MDTVFLLLEIFCASGDKEEAELAGFGGSEQCDLPALFYYHLVEKKARSTGTTASAQIAMSLWKGDLSIPITVTPFGVFDSQLKQVRRS